jgi:hypothetical protein
MSQSEWLGAVLIAGFIVWLAMNQRLSVYWSILLGGGGTTGGTTGGSATPAQATAAPATAAPAAAAPAAPATAAPVTVSPSSPTGGQSGGQSVPNTLRLTVP